MRDTATSTMVLKILEINAAGEKLMWHMFILTFLASREHN
jgi:hypothetical protein